MSEQRKSYDVKEMKHKLTMAIIHFFNEELKHGDLSTDSKDSLEVAIQCLANAYTINMLDCDLAKIPSLLDVFSKHAFEEKNDDITEVITEKAKEKSNEFKQKGNDFMHANKFDEALQAYTEAIKLDPTNPIFYCNRAAACTKLNDRMGALEDCKKALKIDPNYSKAYCRMGLVYTHLEDYQMAYDCFKRALELDSTETNLKNFQLAEKKLEEEKLRFSQLPNLTSLLNNPNFLGMAQKIVDDPRIMTAFTNLMGGYIGKPADANPEAAESASSATGQQSNPNQAAPDQDPLNPLLQFGQSFFQCIRNANPELLEQLKSNMSNVADADSANTSGKEKPSDDKSGQN